MNLYSSTLHRLPSLHRESTQKNSVELRANAENEAGDGLPDLPVIIDYCKEIKRERLRGISILPSREVQRKPSVAVGKNEMRASWTLQQLQRGQE